MPPKNQSSPKPGAVSAGAAAAAALAAAASVTGALAETPPVETPPVETPPVEMPPVEMPPVEMPPVETPPVETPQAPYQAPGYAVMIDVSVAAAAVKRIVPVLDDAGKPTGETKEVAVDEAEVLAWAVRGETVTVVTTDGQKLVGAL